MHEMQTIVTDVPFLFVSLSRMHRVTPHGKADLRLLYCARSFGVAFAKLLWPLVCIRGGT